jgi:poly-D-alanine transfer protein DltD
MTNAPKFTQSSKKQHQIQNKCSTKLLIVQHNRTQELWNSTHQNSTKHRINQELQDLPKDSKIQELGNSRQQLNITRNNSRILEINRT